jgi:hypothetical protein
MDTYYLDVETQGEPGRPDPHVDTLLTIQYQKLHSKTWEPVESLTILKSWELGEAGVVQVFKDAFLPEDHLPTCMVIGHAVHYDKEIVRVFMQRYLGFEKFTAWDFLNKWQCIDSRGLTIFLNGGRLKGSGLKDWTAKPATGQGIADLAVQGRYAEIEAYIVAEAAAYMDFLRGMRALLKDLTPRIRRQLGLPALTDREQRA